MIHTGENKNPQSPTMDKLQHLEIKCETLDIQWLVTMGFYSPVKRSKFSMNVRIKSMEISP